MRRIENWLNARPMGTALCTAVVVSAVLVAIGQAAGAEGLLTEVIGGLVTAVVGIPIAFVLLRAQMREDAVGDRDARQRELDTLIIAARGELDHIEAIARAVVAREYGIDRARPYWVNLAGSRYLALTGDALAIDEVAQAGQRVEFAVSAYFETDHHAEPFIVKDLEGQADAAAAEAMQHVNAARGYLESVRLRD